MTQARKKTAGDAEAGDAAPAGGRTFTVAGVELTVPRKWKRMRFLKALNGGDLWAAMVIVFGAEQLRAIEDLDLDETEFTDLAERLGDLLGGASLGN